MYRDSVIKLLILAIFLVKIGQSVESSNLSSISLDHGNFAVMGMPHLPVPFMNISIAALNITNGTTGSTKVTTGSTNATTGSTGSEFFTTSPNNTALGQPQRLDTSDNFVINGDIVRVGGAPHQIALFIDNEFACGGSLIEKRTVLTAAHCVFDEQNNRIAESRLKVRYNTLDRTKGTIISVSKAIPHSSYTFPHYDIAILHLSEAIKESKNAKIISLVSKKPSVGSSVNVTGWGIFRLPIDNEESVQLRSAMLLLYSQTDCKKLWNNEKPNTFTDNMMCAASSSQSACMGDSGGPLTHGGQLIGVVSYGHDKCKLNQNKPNVFMDVAVFSNWIKDNTYRESSTGSSAIISSIIVGSVIFTIITVGLLTYIFVSLLFCK